MRRSPPSKLHRPGPPTPGPTVPAVMQEEAEDEESSDGEEPTRMDSDVTEEEEDNPDMPGTTCNSSSDGEDEDTYEDEDSGPSLKDLQARALRTRGVERAWRLRWKRSWSGRRKQWRPRRQLGVFPPPRSLHLPRRLRGSCLGTNPSAWT